MQTQVKRVIVFSSLVRAKPVYVNNKKYERFFVLVPSRSEASTVLNSVFDTIPNKSLKDVRLIVQNMIFFIPSLTVSIEQMKDDGRRSFRVGIPAVVGRQILYKTATVVGFIGEGDRSVTILSSKTYRNIVQFEAMARDSGSVAVAIPKKYSDLFQVGQAVEVIVANDSSIKTTTGWVYSGGRNNVIKFKREMMRDYLGHKVLVIAMY